MYDVNDLSKDEYYEHLEEARRKWEERQARAALDLPLTPRHQRQLSPRTTDRRAHHRQARKPGDKLAFTSGGVQPPLSVAPAPAANPADALGPAGAAARAAAAALASKAGQPRKSKWDSSSGGEPDAKRHRLRVMSGLWAARVRRAQSPPVVSSAVRVPNAPPPPHPACLRRPH